MCNPNKPIRCCPQKSPPSCIGIMVKSPDCGLAEWSDYVALTSRLSIVTSKTLLGPSRGCLECTISCLVEYWRYTVFPRTCSTASQCNLSCFCKRIRVQAASIGKNELEFCLLANETHQRGEVRARCQRVCTVSSACAGSRPQSIQQTP